MTTMQTIDWTHEELTPTLASMTLAEAASPDAPSPTTTNATATNASATRTETQARRRTVGERLDRFALTTLSHGTITVPGLGYTHLQFRRFAGCPVCNLHLRSFAQGIDRLTAAHVQTVAFFHSSAELMRPYQGDLPFPTVPDADRVFYRSFGVERSLLAVAHPRVMVKALHGLVSAPSNPFAGGTEQTGLPADFLIDGDGTIVALHYGRHADDQWSLDEVIALATGGAHSTGAATSFEANDR
jgi:peroxiredoxin